MKKIVVQNAGSYEKLLIESAETSKPGPGEVLISCRASGVNFADCCVRMGVYRPAKVFVGWPITPGFEVSGTIEAIGESVSRFHVGQRVLALTLFGGYASHLVVQQSQVFPLPDTLSFEQGAAFPTIFLTAYYGLCELVHPKKGLKILIHSAAGGVGSALVQLAKLQDCFVVGVVGSSHKLSSVKKLGADVVIDKSKQSLWNEAEKLVPSGYDVILDANGPETLKESYEHLAPGGKLVVYGFHTMLSKGRGKPNWFKVIWDYIRTPRFNPLNMTTDNHSVMAFNLAYFFDQSSILSEMMETLLSLYNENKIKLPKIQTFPFEKVQEAHKALESGQTIGKCVLVFDES